MKNGDYELVVAPPDYPGTLYRGKYCSKHVLIYWQTYGVIPQKDEIIHHEDENKTNDDPSNLKLMKRKEHVLLHNNKRGRKLVELKCPGCDKVFIKEKSKTYLQDKNRKYTCCCKKCAGITANLPELEKQKRIANNFIKEFSDDKSKYNL